MHAVGVNSAEGAGKEVSYWLFVICYRMSCEDLEWELASHQ